MPPHLVFFDASCGLCDRSVEWLLKIDRKEQFIFAPLNGETSATYLLNYPEARSADSLVLLEDYQTAPKLSVRGKAVLSICWKLGGLWKLLGVFSFLPVPLVDPIYCLVAKSRHRLTPPPDCPISQRSEMHQYKERFLP